MIPQFFGHFKLFLDFPRIFFHQAAGDHDLVAAAGAFQAETPPFSANATIDCATDSNPFVVPETASWKMRPELYILA